MPFTRRDASRTSRVFQFLRLEYAVQRRPERSVTVSIRRGGRGGDPRGRRPAVRSVGVQIKDPRLSQAAGYRSVTRDRNNLKITSH